MLQSRILYMITKYLNLIFRATRNMQKRVLQTIFFLFTNIYVSNSFDTFEQYYRLCFIFLINYTQICIVHVSASLTAGKHIIRNLLLYLKVNGKKSYIGSCMKVLVCNSYSWFYNHYVVITVKQIIIETVLYYDCTARIITVRLTRVGSIQQQYMLLTIVHVMIIRTRVWTIYLFC